MIPAPRMYTKERERSDLEDLEVLGSISFDLEINKEEEIKASFVSLVGKLGSELFLHEYAELYKKLLALKQLRDEKKVLDLEGVEITDFPGPPHIEGAVLVLGPGHEDSILQEITTNTSKEE